MHRHRACEFEFERVGRGMPWWGTGCSSWWEVGKPLSQCLDTRLRCTSLRALEAVTASPSDNNNDDNNNNDNNDDANNDNNNDNDNGNGNDNTHRHSRYTSWPVRGAST